jgi:hypothetical protein
MPRKGSPYGPGYERARRRLLGPGVVCHLCGGAASELDHVPALVLHAHVEGSGCCAVFPACGPCQRSQGGRLRAGHAENTTGGEEPEDSPGPGDPRWQVPWLEQLLVVPEDAAWPRFMTSPHPAAVGSFGPDAFGWLAAEAGLDLRWWQRLALARQLEHDADGVLVWLVVLGTTARQVGKSIWLRGGATWRLHQAGRFGEEQTIMHTGKDLPVCKEVQRLARAWAKARGYPTREQNGNEEITEPGSGSRWLVRGKDSVYGYSVSNGLVDEAWGVAPGVVEDGLEPTMAERASPQLELVSTAHTRATPLFPAHRAAALAELDEPGATLLLEWSAHRDAAISDRAAWRQASPHWSPGRERLLEQRLTRVTAGEVLDPDETDPVESFRSQFLNIWPERSAATAKVLLDTEAWAARREEVDVGAAAVMVAVEDHYGHGAAVAAAARAPDGRYELDGWLCGTWAEAFDDVAGIAATRPRVEVIVGPALVAAVEPRWQARVAKPADTRAGLALLRQLVDGAQVTHDDAPDLAQLTTVHVREAPTGMRIAAGRADLVRAAAWAILAAHAAAPEPAIR